MKDNYTSTASRWLFFFGLFISQNLFAQTVPVIQWQKTINIPYSNTAIQSEKAYVVKASSDGYAVTTIHNRLLRLSSQGNTVWEAAIPSSSPDMPNFRQVTQTAGLVAMDDGGFVVLTADTQYWSLVRFSASGQVMWVKPFGDVTPASGGNVSYFYKTALIRSIDGGFVVGGSVGSPRGVTSGQVYLFDAAGNRTAEKDINYYNPSVNSRSFTTIRQIVPAFGGGYVAVGYVSSSSASQPQGWAARIDNELNVIWQNTYALVGPLDDIIQASDGQNYLIAGTTDAVIPIYGGILAIDGAGQLVKTQRSDTRSGDTYQFVGPASISSLPNSSPAQSVLFTTGSDTNRSSDFRLTTPNLRLSLGGTSREFASRFITTDDGGFLLVGTTTSTDGDVQGKVGTTPATWIVKINSSSSSLVITQPYYDCQTGNIRFETNGGNGSSITFTAPGITRNTSTSIVGIVEQGLRNDPKTIKITATQNGYSTSYDFDLKAFCSNTTPTPPTTGGTLTLTQPTYNCSTGTITFNSTGGDGSTITYSAPGIMRSSATSNTGTVEQGLRNDPKTLLITAMQSGQMTTYSFDFKSFCSGNPPTPTPTPTPPATGNGLVLTAPTYNCSTGAITFNYTGGNGSPVEFQAAGITGWTTNPNQFVDKDSRTANDVKPFTLMARQNGQVVTYTWDLKASCGRSARIAAAEAGQGLQLTVKGNPVVNTAIVAISGVEGQPVQLDLLNASGHVLEQRHIEQAGTVDEQRFELQRQPSGMLFLRAQSGQQHQTVKLIKQ